MMVALALGVIPTHGAEVVTSSSLNRPEEMRYQARCTCGWKAKSFWDNEAVSLQECETHLMVVNDVGELIFDIPWERPWRCECGDLNGVHEAFCYRCGAGPPEDE